MAPIGDSEDTDPSPEVDRCINTTTGKIPLPDFNIARLPVSRRKYLRRNHYLFVREAHQVLDAPRKTPLPPPSDGTTSGSVATDSSGYPCLPAALSFAAPHRIVSSTVPFELTGEASRKHHHRERNLPISHPRPHLEK